VKGYVNESETFLFHDQQKEIMVQFEVALFVTVTIYTSLLGFVLAGEVAEVKAFLAQFVTAHPCFAGGVQRHQDAPVFAQDVVDITDVIRLIAVQFIVVRDAALVGAKFFVGPALDFISAFQTGFFFDFSHDFRVFQGFLIR
jgi:hypothetical protein